jgi:hypothetical protein
MNRYRTGKAAKWAVWLTLLGVMTIGCSPLQTLGFLLHSDQKLPAEYPLRPKDGEKKEREKELTVLLLTQFSPGQAYEVFAVGADKDLAARMAQTLTEYAKADKQKLVVLSQQKLDVFKVQNPNWKAMRPAEIGKKLGADVVLDVAVGQVQVYQQGSLKQVYEGGASVDVAVYDTADPTMIEKGKYVHAFTFPKTKLGNVEEMPLPNFRMEFIRTLADELARKHVDHKPDAGIATR